jgi:hypothetical protein
VVALTISAQTTDLKAQTVLSTGADLYSTYVFRGVAYSGSSLQPHVEVATGALAIGAWGSQGYDGFQEMDLYASYRFDFGLSVGVTDYFYPSTSTGATGPFLEADSHAFEANMGYELDAISLSANYVFGGLSSSGDDLYFEAEYSIDHATAFFVGAGNGWNTNGTNDFGLVNLGISTGKKLTITETFSIPVSAAVIINPYSEDLYIVAGFSF